MIGPRVRRILIMVWRYGRNIPWLLRSLYWWPRLACSSGLGRFKPRKEVWRRARPVNWPGTRSWRLTPAGFSFVIKHKFGQSTMTVRQSRSALESGLHGMIRINRVHGKPHQSRIIVLRRDPFLHVPPPLALSTTKFRIGVIEDGRDYIMDLRAAPHWLIVGCTNSGKSGTSSAVLAAMAPTNLQVCLIDLKHGISAEPFRQRASIIAEDQQSAVHLLRQALDLSETRATLCKEYCVDSVHDLPPSVRPPEIVIMIDEVAELGVDEGDKETKTLATQGIAYLVRCVQLLRAFGIHMIICGQRFGSSFGPQITNVRAQLDGRICLKINDAETGRMAMADVATEAIKEALNPDTLPGVAIVKGGPDLWQRVRMSRVTHPELAEIASLHSDQRILWTDLLLQEKMIKRQEALV